MGNPWILLSVSVLILATDMDTISMDSTHRFLMKLTLRTSQVVQIGDMCSNQCFVNISLNSGPF